MGGTSSMRIDCLDLLFEEWRDLMERTSCTEILVPVLCSWWRELLERLMDSWGFEADWLEGSRISVFNNLHRALSFVLPSLCTKDSQCDNLQQTHNGSTNPETCQTTKVSHERSHLEKDFKEELKKIQYKRESLEGFRSLIPHKRSESWPRSFGISPGT